MEKRFWASLFIISLRVASTTVTATELLTIHVFLSQKGLETSLFVISLHVASTALAENTSGLSGRTLTENAMLCALNEKMASSRVS